MKLLKLTGFIFFVLPWLSGCYLHTIGRGSLQNPSESDANWIARNVGLTPSKDIYAYGMHGKTSQELYAAIGKDAKVYGAKKCGDAGYKITGFESLPSRSYRLRYQIPHAAANVTCIKPTKATPAMSITTPSPSPTLSPSSSTTKKMPLTNHKNETTLNEAKKECAELGFKTGTEKFGTCVLQLTDN